MKRNRLNHFADAIIEILNDWRLIADAEVFNRCGAGVYSIDLLRKTVTFNSKAITVLPVFSHLFEWFENETKENTNPEAVLTTAKVIFTVGEKSESDPYCLEYRLSPIFCTITNPRFCNCHIPHKNSLCQYCS